MNLRLKKCLGEFEQYRKKILKSPFAELPWQDMSQLKHFTNNPFEKTVVVGIGGSSLGAKALLSGNKKITFLDNIDPDFVDATLRGLNLKKTLFLLISKSGETIEITSLAKILFSKIKSSRNFLLITDNKQGSLFQMAKKRGIQILYSSENVPGRFSVLSITGLLPAILAGLKIDEILDSARRVSWREAYNLACHQYLHALSGKNISVLFTYSEKLSVFAQWYVQLLAESIGKSKKIGITPIRAMGVKDQHSQLQLFLDGPDDKFYILIKPKSFHSDFKVAGETFSLSKLLEAEYKGVKGAFIKKKKPFAEILLPKITPEIFGELFFFFELEIAFLGALFNINFSNQPAVELSKKITKSILK